MGNSNLGIFKPEVGKWLFLRTHNIEGGQKWCQMTCSLIVFMSYIGN